MMMAGGSNTCWYCMWSRACEACYFSYWPTCEYYCNFMQILCSWLWWLLLVTTFLCTISQDWIDPEQTVKWNGQWWWNLTTLAPDPKVWSKDRLTLPILQYNSTMRFKKSMTSNGEPFFDFWIYWTYVSLREITYEILSVGWMCKSGVCVISWAWCFCCSHWSWSTHGTIKP